MAKKKACIISLVMVVLGMLGCTWFRTAPSPAQLYEERFGITLPENMEVLFHLNTREGFRQDGKRYTVFQLHEPLSYAKFNAIFEGEGESHHTRTESSFLSSFNMHFHHESMGIYDIIFEEYRPNFEQEFYWGPKNLYRNWSALWAFYFPYNMRLILMDVRI